MMINDDDDDDDDDDKIGAFILEKGNGWSPLDVNPLGFMFQLRLLVGQEDSQQPDHLKRIGKRNDTGTGCSVWAEVCEFRLNIVFIDSYPNAFPTRRLHS